MCKFYDCDVITVANMKEKPNVSADYLVSEYVNMTCTSCTVMI